jgi:MFS transporter, DHA1 family, staphyloferrin B biosynthesis exporter
MLKGYLSRLPLTDRITFSRELWSGTFYGIFVGLALPLITIMARRIGMSPEEITVMLTMQYAGALLGVLLGQAAATRAKMPFVLWPGIMSRGLIGMLAFARTPVLFLVIASAFYFLSNLSGPAYAGIMRRNYSNPHRGRLMGNIRILITIVSALVSSAAGLILAANEDIVRWLFLLAAVFGILSALSFGSIKVRREPGPQREPRVSTTRSGLRRLGNNRPLLVFLGLQLLCAFPDKLAVPLEPIWMVDVLHIGYGEASFLLGTVVSLASVVGYFIWARALKRVNPFTVLSAVVLVYAARFAAMALARTSSQLLAMGIFSGLANAGWDLVPLFCLIALSDASSFSLAFGLHWTLFGIRGLAGPALGTSLYSSGALSLSGMFWMIAGTLSLGAALMMVFARRGSTRRLLKVPAVL